MKAVLISLLFLTLSCKVYAEDTLVFCDVGQGDTALIRLENNIDILIDAGTGEKVLSCLNKHMNPFDPTIEVALLSHADSDHYEGFNTLLSRYKVNTIILPHIDNTASSYGELKQLLELQKSEILTMHAHDKIYVGNSTLSFLYPSISDISTCLPDKRNKCSYIVHFALRSFSVLFTGDTEPSILQSLMSANIPEVEVLKIPHHGSKNGLTEDFLKKVNPLVSIISSGKDNRYGHPHTQILTMLENYKYLRTDQKGAIVIVIP